VTPFCNSYRYSGEEFDEADGIRDRNAENRLASLV